MLIGQYEANIGKKYQVSFPRNFKKELGTRLVITKGFENCLIIVSSNHWEALLEGTIGTPFTNKNSREVQRFLLGNATEVSLDAKGRFIIPEYLRQHAHINREIVFLGIQRFVEVWDKITWESHQEYLRLRVSSVADKLEREK